MQVISQGTAFNISDIVSALCLTTDLLTAVSEYYSPVPWEESYLFSLSFATFGMASSTIVLTETYSALSSSPLFFAQCFVCMCNARWSIFTWSANIPFAREMSPILMFIDLPVTPVSPTGDSIASLNLLPRVMWDLPNFSSTSISTLWDASSPLDAPRRAFAGRCFPVGKSAVILGACTSFTFTGSWFTSGVSFILQLVPTRILLSKLKGGQAVSRDELTAPYT